ncbi:response regulator transcription factor [Aeromonas hydrophila]|uniref:response regulator transcription factor n=1 Tax=Aeromonas hydrophila TaxID=644 RepID=UPI000332BB52|nr:response regulator transcription factor [Aeromonas hydrophila]AGM41857.1 positive transcription regulator EvgA [Aeromonas hydrophila ML09-119]AHX30598.1 LuxR family transcriptional regulator [Aeromonas hydrophila subsp. hydrophila AL09-71]AHX67394.1 LuxR family transcriptional regulator [Aeromonas hydrophila pc104A]AJE34460.1 LuxR family transcriptional regulator [Aeromonas hydrophila J-1]AKJ32656.1 LuxR family transcriptional regulator [Aeromonas hydrophila NJ-35]
MAKILIVDDHPAIRMAVNILLKQDGHHILAEVDNGVDAISYARKNKPEMVVLDIGIPRLDGIEVIKRLKDMDASIQVVILSAQATHHIMVRCLQAGADGFISKLDDLSLLKNALDKIGKGQLYFPRDIIAGARHAHEVDRTDLLSALSDREMSVLLLICQGHTNKQIAENMLLSEKTVSTYKTRLMQKLNVTNMVDLISLAKRQELL